MATARFGFLSANFRRGPHYDDFLRLTPDEAEIDIIPLGLWRESLYDLKGKTQEHIERTTALAAEHRWDAIALMGAPMQVQNPEHIHALRAALDLPVTTALEAGAAALHAFGASRALLLTPFDDGLNALLREFLVGEGLYAAVPPANRDDTRREDVASTERMSPDQVHRLALDAFAETPDAEAVYFQGAPLNPLPVLDRIESDLGVPVVASNPAMLWHAAALIGARLPSTAPGCGKLLREWPAPR